VAQLSACRALGVGWSELVAAFGFLPIQRRSRTFGDRVARKVLANPVKFLIATQCNTHQDSRVQKSITTSVRLPRDLKRRIDRKAVSAGSGRNRVIIDALELYLREDDQAVYETEARRQSQLATTLDRPDSAWDEMIERDLPGR